jgi:hypothetical protein
MGTDLRGGAWAAEAMHVYRPLRHALELGKKGV